MRLASRPWIANCPALSPDDIRLPETDRTVAVVGAPLDYSRPPHLQSAELPTGLGDNDQVIILSHAAVSGLDYRHPQCIDEARSDARVVQDDAARYWRNWEDAARAAVPASRLLVLRLPFQPAENSNDPLRLALAARKLPHRPGFDCAFQIISRRQLVAVLEAAMETRLTGTFNCAPRPVVRTSQLAGSTSSRQRPVTGTGNGRLCGIEGLHAAWWRLFRYPCTLDSRRFEGATGIRWEDHLESNDLRAEGDPYGLDPATVLGTSWHRPAARQYWRLSVTGSPNLPSTGSAILIGPHRGFMPYDAVMMAYWLASEHNRIPRYLVHHCLLRYPILGQYIRRMGGLPACQENALSVLREGELLAVFPEGIQGTFRYLRQSYTLGSFGRGDFIRWALMTQSPILSYVCAGPAESYPIFYKINWRWWKKTVEWPAFPITATFPFLPMPLPTKWHFHFLPPIDLRDRFPGLQPDDEQGIRRASKSIRAEMQHAMSELKRRRKNWFWGALRA